MLRVTAALAFALLVAAAIVAGITLNVQAVHGAEPLYTTPRDTEASGTSTATTLTVTTITTTTPSPPETTSAQPPCRNETVIAAYYEAGAIQGKGFLATCIDDGKSVEVHFYFMISTSEVRYGGLIATRGGATVQAYSNPLTISLTAGDGRVIVVANAAGDQVNVTDYYKFEYTSSLPAEASGLLQNATSVIVEMPFNTTSASFTLKGVGEVEVYVPMCSLDVKVVFNKTSSSVDIPRGYRGVTLEAPGGESVNIAILAYNEGGSAVVRITVYAKADHSSNAANMAVGALEWLWSHGLLQGMDGEDLSRASQVVANVISEYCSRGDSLSILVYWNGSSWEWWETPMYKPVSATPVATPTSVDLYSATTTTMKATSLTVSKSTSPAVATEAQAGTGPLGAKATLGASGTSAAGWAAPSGLLAGLMVGVVAALAVWLLVRRV